MKLLVIEMYTKISKTSWVEDYLSPSLQITHCRKILLQIKRGYVLVITDSFEFKS